MAALAVGGYLCYKNKDEFSSLKNLLNKDNGETKTDENKDGDGTQGVGRLYRTEHITAEAYDAVLKPSTF